MTAGMSSVTEAASHLFRACGSRGFGFFVGSAACCFFFLRVGTGVLMMSSGARGTGTASSTPATSAICLRPCFSPGDSRVTSLFSADSAAFAVAGRRACGRMTMPLPSNVRTSGQSFCGGSSGFRQA
jgi:hypothetical protein